MPAPKKKAPAKKKAKSKAPKKAARAASAAADRKDLVDRQNWFEVLAIICTGLGVIHFLSLISYTPYDLPNWVPFSRVAGGELISTSNFIGEFGAVIAGFSFFLFGAACYLIPVVVAWLGGAALLGFHVLRWRTLGAALAFLISASCIADLQTAFFQGWIDTYQLPKSEGGLSGYVFNQLIVGRMLGPVGGGIIFFVAYLVSLILLTGFHPFEMIATVKREIDHLFSRAAQLPEPVFEPSFPVGNSLPPKQKRKRATRKAQPEFDDEFDGDPEFEPEIDAPKSKRKRAKSKKAASTPDDLDDKPPFDIDEKPAEPPRPEPKIIDSNERKPRPKETPATLADTPIGGSFGPTGDQFKDYQLPSLDLLAYDDDEDENPTDKSELISTQNTIVEALGTFGVKVTAGDITRGPSITRYEVYPAKGLSVKKIVQYEKDLARATRAERINILAPIPGKDTVGIELANSNRVLVPLRELFEDPKFLKGKAHIPLALGKDVYGKPVIADLASMPHLLVAGATGSGKSVCINSIIASLLFRFTPEELRFIMIDPKVVEMQIFNSLPHLAVPVVTNPKKVLLALRWCLNEMERRYEMFAKVKVRKLEEFNNRHTRRAKTRAAKEAKEAKNAKDVKIAKASDPKPDQPELPLEPAADGMPPDGERDIISGDDVFIPAPIQVPPPPALSPEPALAHAVVLNDEAPAAAESEKEESEDETGDEFPERLPYVVVIIDELADLMQTAPADVETAVSRLCQKARAAGIHLIVATQSPRVDVVTGLIKANIPARIAFQVASSTDSRVILDKTGAEKLVGKGDMLYQPPDSPVQVRSQGAFLTEEEVIDIVDHCAKQAEPVFESDIQDTLNGADGDETEVTPEDEETLDRCLEVIMTERKASTSFLQRRLRLGYTRAARMMDILEERGIVGPGDGAKPREILVDLGEEID